MAGGRHERDGGRRNLRATFRALVRRLDPNDDPAAEPVSATFLVVFATLAAVSAWTFLRFRIQPMQDLGHHAALSAIVADRGRPGSMYTALYEPFDPLYANSLLYSVAGLVGRWGSVIAAVRGCIVFYLVGTPLAMLYALRCYGRSPWPAVLSVVLVYGMNYVAGFANFLFAAPFLIASIALFSRFLARPTRGRGAATAIAFAATFLAHAQLYLFLGLVTLAMLVARLTRRRPRFEPAGPSATTIVLGSLLVATPSLAVFGRWCAHVFFSSATSGGAGLAQASAAPGLGATFLSRDELLHGLFDHAFRSTHRPEEAHFAIALLVISVAAVAIARRASIRAGGPLEFAFLLSLALYFVLPENVVGQHVIATRHVGVALWFLPAFVSPVPARVSRIGRAFVVIALVAYSALFLRFWNRALEDFQRFEAHGLAQVLRAAPGRLELTYAKWDPNSVVFRWRPFWHVEKLYMAERLGDTPDSPAIYLHSPVRYRPGMAPPRIDPDPRFPLRDDVFSRFDLVLLRRFRPSAEILAALESKATLVLRRGDWEIWRRRRAPVPASP